MSLRAERSNLPPSNASKGLEVSLRLQTLAEIAQEHGIDLPGYGIERLRPFATVTNEEPNFHRFLQKLQLLRRFYTTRAAIERLAYEAVDDAAADNVNYLEMNNESMNNEYGVVGATLVARSSL